MKKILLTLTAASAMCYCSYGQGVMSFTSSTGILDDFTANGSPTKAAGDVYVDFIWMAGASATAFSDFGTSASGAAASLPSPWADLDALSVGTTGASWGLASLSDLAKVDSVPPSADGEYNGNAVTLADMAAGDVISMYVIAWSTASGTSLPSSGPIGWSAEFNYTLGSSTSPGAALGASGGGFDVDPVPTPEPTTIALAGLGGLSMLFLRRRKA